MTDSGETVDLELRGNVTSLQFSNVTITQSQSTLSTTVSFSMTGESGNSGFSIMTIPKALVLSGTKPVVLIDGQPASNQGYTQDPENFYVWYTTQFSTHQIKIQFGDLITRQDSSFGLLFVAIIAPEIVFVYTVIAVRRLRRKPENA